ncbi:sugar phosphate isomerase/epimerase family protein [Dyadobacter psychrotolerans]|nr:TIM barrel protein [Dyadobacter psychrotolerans]
MKELLLCLIFVFSAKTGFTQKVTNDFFTLHNIIRGDSVYNTFDKQVELIKKAGFAGVEINQTESFEGMKAALDKNNFTGSYFYVKLRLDEPHVDPKLRLYIQQLKGSKTIIAPFILNDSKKFKPSSREADTLVIKLVREIGEWAKASGLQVAIYPHLGYYVERTDHALELVKKINQKNVGLTFNLCHWLATTTAEERSDLNPHLNELKPYLKMITISGANDVFSQQKNVWEDYILPLGKGSFDTYGMVKYLVKDLGFKAPIGVQCYNIKGDKPELIKITTAAWKDYKVRIETGK